jgi:predicted Rossmann fold nucleotide-binding protein DprA/Smf involved in DNA uptake
LLYGGVGAGWRTFDNGLSPTQGDFTVTEFLDSTVKEIDARLSELKQEVAKLEAARSALVGTRRGPGRPRGTTTRRSTRRASTTTTTRRTRRSRGRRGGATRANQALELVRSTPGITIPQIAQQMGIEPNYLYRVLPKLQQEGQIKRDGQGWIPAGN